MLISFAPANKMEAYFRFMNQAREGKYADLNDKGQVELSRQYGVEIVGPPLAIPS